MAQVSKSRVVPHQQEKMYRLINDIDSYHQFLPWCSESRILSQDDEQMRATIEISKGPVRKRFTTRNRLMPNREIGMQLVEGPFKFLKGSWRFQEIENSSCRVSLELNFEFSSGLVAAVFGPVFHQIANTMVDAFAKRAKELYG